MKIYPWQEPLWANLMRRTQALPHALLLNGPRGVGKRDFALALAQALLCSAPLASGEACGKCASCNWFGQGSHPDFRCIEPEAITASEADPADAELRREKRPAAQIGVGQVRALANFVNLTSHRGGMRVALLHPAENLNTHAANALLKTLEEPPAHALFLLVSHHARQILPTIRSRCQALTLASPPREAALKWLHERRCQEPELLLGLAGNAPLEALRLAQSDSADQRKAFLTYLAQPRAGTTIGAAEQAQRFALPDVLRWLQTWCFDLLALRMTGHNRYHLDFAEQQGVLVEQCSVFGLLDLERHVAASRRIAEHPLNAKLFLESLLWPYFKLFVR
jgi:DNA polymerase III subunit delta'